MPSRSVGMFVDLHGDASDAMPPQGIDRYVRYCARVGMPGWKDPPWRLAPAPPG